MATVTRRPRGSGFARSRAKPTSSRSCASRTPRRRPTASSGAPASRSSASDVRHPNASFDPARDVTIAEIDGRVVAAAQREVVDTTDGHREYRLDGDRRSRLAAARHRPRRPRRERAPPARARAPSKRPAAPILGSWSWESPGRRRRRSCERPASSAARWFFDMVRPTLDDVPDVPLPDGPRDPPDRPRRWRAGVWDADVEAFADHWGGFDHSEEHLQRWLDNPVDRPLALGRRVRRRRGRGRHHQRDRRGAERGARRPARLAPQRLHAAAVAPARPRHRADRPVARSPPGARHDIGRPRRRRRQPERRARACTRASASPSTAVDAWRKDFS